MRLSVLHEDIDINKATNEVIALMGTGRGIRMSTYQVLAKLGIEDPNERAQHAKSIADKINRLEQMAKLKDEAARRQQMKQDIRVPDFLA